MPTAAGAAMLGVVLLASLGCTSWSEYVHNGFKVGPNYCPPPAPVAQQWVEEGDPLVDARTCVLPCWWRSFDDPVLGTLIDAAYRQNLTLRVAGLRVLEARALRGIAVGELFPQSQDAFGSYSRQAASGNGPRGVPVDRFFNEWQTGAGLSWELDFWGRYRRGIETADANLDASVWNYNDALVLLLSEVAQSYVDLRTAERRLEYARQNVGIQRQSLNLAQTKYDAGSTTLLDVTQAESNVAQTEATIPPLETTRRQAINQLCILLGTPPRDLDPLLVRAHGIPRAAAQVAVGIPAELLRRRPDVRRAEREVAAQSAQIGIAVAQLYPAFYISGDIFLDATRFSDLFESRSLAGNVGPSFQWNILHYGRLVNNIRVQDARFQQRVLEYQDTVLRANAEAEDALIAFLNYQRQVRWLKEGTLAAQKSLELVQTQYQGGTTDFNRVLTVQQTLTQQQDSLAVAQGGVSRSLVLLYAALGGGWEIRDCGPEPPLPAPGPPPTEVLPTPVPSPSAPQPPPSAPQPPDAAGGPDASNMGPSMRLVTFDEPFAR
ncbi:MAG: efflux transporter outer membrane subunit [Planctomycetia bacterium]|nr:efflux transporter outer membrane subunit [Planctomycetia bacterium]